MANVDLIGFRDLIYTIFIIEKKYPVEAIARLMGIEEPRLRSYIGGYQYFPVDLIPNLYNATVLFDIQRKRSPFGEMRIWTFLMQDTGLEAVAIDRANDADPVEKDLLDIHVIAGELTNYVVSAREDGRISEREAEDISNIVSRLNREAENVRAKNQPGKVG